MPGSDAKSLTEVEKWKTYAEVCKWTDQKTGKIVNNGIERIIKAVFDQIEEKMWWMKGKVLKIQQGHQISREWILQRNENSSYKYSIFFR